MQAKVIAAQTAVVALELRASGSCSLRAIE